LSVDELYRQLTIAKGFKPAKGNALWVLFTCFPPDPGEFLIATHDAFVRTNKRLVTQSDAPGDYSEIILPDVLKGNFWQARQGILKFKLRSGKNVEISGIPFQFPSLKKMITRGAFTRPL
jgi:hypothetical protein